MTGFFVGLLMLGGLGAFIGPMIFEPLCGNEVVHVYPSMDKSLNMVLFQRDCGATTGFTTQISILKSGKELPNDGGNIFIADSGDQAVPLGKWGGPLVDVKWIDKNKVAVAYPKGARIFLKEQKYKNVIVEYQAR